MNNPKTLELYHENKGLAKINQHNRDILKRLLGSKESHQVSEQELITKGFKQEYMINKAQMTSAKNVVFLYLDFGLELIGIDMYKIFKHDRRF